MCPRLFSLFLATRKLSIYTVKDKCEVKLVTQYVKQLSIALCVNEKQFAHESNKAS